MRLQCTVTVGILLACMRPKHQYNTGGERRSMEERLGQHRLAETTPSEHGPARQPLTLLY